MEWIGVKAPVGLKLGVGDQLDAGGYEGVSALADLMTKLQGGRDAAMAKYKAEKRARFLARVDRAIAAAQAKGDTAMVTELQTAKAAVLAGQKTID